MHQNLSYLSVINFKWSPYLWINCITAPQICQSIKAFSKEMMILIWIWETLVSDGSYQEGTKGEGFPPIPTPDTIHAFTFTLFLKMALTFKYLQKLHSLLKHLKQALTCPGRENACKLYFGKTTRGQYQKEFFVNLYLKRMMMGVPTANSQVKLFFVKLSWIPQIAWIVQGSPSRGANSWRSFNQHKSLSQVLGVEGK